MTRRLDLLFFTALAILACHYSYSSNKKDETAITFTNSATVSVDENISAATTVTATGAATITYSITGGADQALFSIDASTGALIFTDIPDFENPSDANLDQLYEVQVTASDGVGGSANQLLSITITDATETETRFVDLPVFITGDENGTEVHTFQASAGDAGGTISFSIIGGIHQSLFQINSMTGVLTYTTPQDAETTSSLNVMLRATDGVTNHDINLGVSVGDVDEFPLSFPAAGPFSLFEGRTQVAYLPSSDADRSNASYTITGGADASAFTATNSFDPTTFQPAGLLEFATAPIFASPSDANGDNVYEVEVTATSGSQAIAQTISVTVNEETPTYTLTVTVQNATKTYGDANPAFTITYSGFQGSDDESILDTAPTVTTAIDETTGAGSHAISASGGVDGLYIFNYVGGTLTINKRILTISPNDVTLVHGDQTGGQLTTDVGFVVTNFANGEDINDVTFTSTESKPLLFGTGTSDVGTYTNFAIYTTAAPVMAAHVNYDFSYGQADLIVTPAPITVSAVAASKTYDQDAGSDPAFTYTAGGLPTGGNFITYPDPLTLLTGSPIRVAGEAVGTYAIQQGSVAVNNSNYAINSFVEADFTINKAQLTVQPGTALIFKAYGDAVPSNIALQYSGFVGSDNASGIDTPPTFTAAVDETTVVSSTRYAVTGTGGTDDSYTFNFVDGELQVVRRQITINIDDQTIHYGDAMPSGAALTFTVPAGQLANGEDFSTAYPSGIDLEIGPTILPVFYPVVGTYAERIVITHPTGFSDNYFVSTNPGVAPTADVIVDPRPVTIPTLTPLSTAYTGSAISFTPPTLSNPVLSGTLAQTVEYKLTSESVSAYTETAPTAIGSYDVRVSLASSETNFTATPETTTLTITKIPATVFLNSLTHTYDGMAKAAGATTSPSGLTVDITYEGTGGTTYTLSSTAPTSPGTYSVVGTINDMTYFGTETATLTINKAPAIVTISNLSQNFNGTQKAVTTSTNPSGLNVDVTYDGGTTVPSAAGTYTVVATINEANYQGSDTQTLTIATVNATISLNLPGSNPVYSGMAQGISPTADDLMGNPTLSLETEYSVQGANAFSTSIPVDAGAYDVRVNLASSEINYHATEATGTFTIDKAPLTATLDNTSVVYGTLGANNHPVTFSGFVNSETQSVLTINSGHPTVSFYDATGSAHYAVGGPHAGAITWSADANTNITSNNYVITFLPGDLTVTPRPIEVSGDNRTITYGDDANTGNTVTFESNDEAGNRGLASGESSADFTGSLSFSNIIQTNVGSYTGVIIPSGYINSNYSITYVNGDLTINKATLTVTADDQNRDYGVSNPTLTISYTGFANSETASVLDVAPTANTSATVTSNVGTYDIVPSGGSDGNYDFSFVNGTLTINKATLTVTADDQNRNYGVANPTFTISYTGFANSETAGVLDVAPTASTSATVTSNVGTYDIVPSGGSDGNYDFSFVNGTLTINKATLTATADDENRDYGVSNPTLTISYTGFANSETASVLDVAPTASTSATVTSNVGTYDIVPSGGSDGNYDFSFVNGTLTINKATLTVTADDQSRSYGASNPTFTISYTGFANSESASVLDAAPTASTSVTVSSNVGTYDIVPSGGSDGNYDFSFVNGTLTINKATLTVTADDQNRNYGVANPTFTISYTGFANSETASVLDVAPTASTSATVASNVGTYDIVPSGGSDGNYDFSFVNGTLTINKATLTATADDQNRDYGVSNPTLTISYTGFANSETASVLDVAPTAITSATVISNVGTYDIVPSGGSDGNYDFSFANGTLTINKATLTATADDQNRDYGVSNPTLTISYTGFANSESASVLDAAPTASTSATVSSNVGTYDIVPSGGSDGNYDFSFANGTLTINKATLTATADDQNRDYGVSNPTLTISYTGFANSETASVLDAAPTAATSATVASNVGTYDIVPSGGSDGNYDFSFVNGTLTINKATLTVTADDQNRDYGASNPTLTISYTGFANSETASVLDVAPTVTTSATVTSNVGTYDIVPSGGSDGNYDFSFTNGTLTINKATLTVTADDQNRNYGVANPTFTISYTGFANSETASVLDVAPTASTSATVTSNVGTYDIVPSGGSDGNYDFSFVNGTLTINKATLTVTADDQNRSYGASNPIFTISYTGFANSETASVLDVAPTASTSATVTSNVGTYDIVPSGGSDGNYDFSFANGTLTINKATLTVTADDQNRNYGVANPTFTISYTGFANSETASVLDVAPTASTSATVASNVGTYDIVPSGGSDGNYDFSFVNGTLTINKATLTATADDQNRDYGVSNPTLTISYTGFANSETASVLDVAPTASTSATVTSNVGTYDIVPSGGSDGNYDFSFVNGTLTINKATLTAMADDQNRNYGVANTTFTISYTGFANSETASVLDVAPTVTTSATVTSNVGTYDIVPSGGSDGNYDFSFTNGTLTINKATLTVTADDQNRNYGVANPTFTISYTGFANSETASVLDVAPTASTSATVTSNVGTYDIVPSGGSDGNYDFSFVNGTLTINKATLTVTADDQNRSYGASNPIFTISYTGFANSETASVLDVAPTASTSATVTSNVGTYDIVPSGGSDGNYDFSFANGTLTINKATLTVTADDQNRNYGVANPTFTISYTGFANSETASVLDVAPTASTSATVTSNVGTYDIVPSSGSDGNYDFNFANGTLTINKATLTATADDQNRDYGVSNPTLTISYTGFANSETASVLDAAPTAATSATVASNVGTYDIVPSGGSDGNYDFSFANGTLTVNKATLTARLDDANFTYGTTTVENHPVTYSGFVNGDTESVLTISADGIIADVNEGGTLYTNGHYPVSGTPYAGGIQWFNTGNTITADNYDINYTAGDLTVTKAALTITADNRTISYGVDANEGNTVTYGTYVSGEDETFLTGTLSFNNITDVNVGSYTGAIVPTGLTSDNYEITFVAGDLTINQATLQVTADDQSKTYGDANPSLRLSYSGFQNGDDETSLTTAPTASTAADATSSVGTYAITASGGVDDNYTFSYTDGTLTVNQATLTVTADDQSKTYGDANPSLTLTYSGFQNGDDETSLTTAPTASTTANATSSVGTYVITASGGVDDNYTFSYTDGTLTVNQATLTVTADDQSKTYGDANPSLTLTYSGFQNGDDETSLTTAPTATTSANATSSVGTYAITAAGGVADNYVFNYTDGTLTVNQAVLTVTADDQAKTYGGANPTLTITYSGFVNGEDETVLTTAATASTSADATSSVGTYSITASGGVADNYTFSYTDGTLTVNQAALTVTADDQAKTYGDANPTLTITYSGFVNGEDETVLTTAATASTTADATSSVGTYSITASGGVDDNYTFSYTDGTLTVNQATLTVTADDQSKVYGDANPTLTITYSGFVNGEDETVLTTAPTASTTANATSSVGTYAITASGGVDDNYTFSYTDGTLTVNQATLTVTADDQSKTYNEVNPTLTLTYSGFVNGEDASALDTSPVASTTATQTSDAGTYPITVSDGVSTNYSFSYVEGTLTVNKADQTITFDALVDRTVGDAAFDLTATASSGLSITYTSSDENVASVSGSTVTILNAGTTTVTASQAGGTNFNAASEVVQTLTVNNNIQDQTITFEALDNQVYGASSFELTGTASSGLTIAYSSSDETIATISGSTVTILSVGTTTITASQVGNDSYTAAADISQTLTIDPATLTVTADDQTKAYGEANPTLTFTYAGFQNGEDETVLTTVPTVATIAEAGSDVGTYVIEIAGGSAANYMITPVNGTLTITKAGLTITAADQTMRTGEAVPTLTTTMEGYVNGDTEADLDILPAIATEATSSSPSGLYDITLTGGEDNNYEYTLINGTLTVETVLGLVLEQTQIMIYPNPVVDKLHIDFPQSLSGEEITVQLFDMEGRKLQSQRVEGYGLELDVSQISTGMLILQMSAGGEVIRKRVKKD